MEAKIEDVKKKILLLLIIFLIFNGTVINCFAVIDSEEPGEVSVTDIIVSDYEGILEVGSTMTLSATVYPDDATEQTIIYSCVDTAIATVNQSGEVKGLSAGKTDIVMTCGDFEKRIPITIKVSAELIKVNETYVVLTQGDNFKIKANILPNNTTDKTLKYTSADNEIAMVDKNGNITAKTCGATAIKVSNADTDTVITVIVNDADTIEQPQIDKDGTVINNEIAESMGISECSLVSSETLKTLYNEQKSLQIKADNYIMEIDGRFINNFNNEVHTDIMLEKTKDKISFNVNGNNQLCGVVSLYIEGADEYKYLYLYNKSTKSRDLIQLDNLNKIDITMPGEYTLTEEPISEESISWWLFGISLGVVAILAVIYICIKKQYWFW